MIIQSLRDYIADINDEAVIFTEPSFDKSIIGMSDTDCVIYDYNKMIDEYMSDNDMDPEDEDSYMEAMEFIDYNTIRALPYAGTNAPIILYSLDMEFQPDQTEEA